MSFVHGTSEFVKGYRRRQLRQRGQRYRGLASLALLQLRGGQDVELPLIEIQRVDGVVIFMGQESEHIDICVARGFRAKGVGLRSISTTTLLPFGLAKIACPSSTGYTKQSLNSSFFVISAKYISSPVLSRIESKRLCLPRPANFPKRDNIPFPW